MTIVETERLRLRWLTPNDAAFMLELVNDPTWIEFIGKRNVNTVEEARTYITTKYVADYNGRGFGLNLVELKDSGMPVGICGLIKRETLEDVDVGFAFLPRYAGQGYATESAAAVLEHGRRALGIGRIVAITLPHNLRSIRVLEKAGLRFERIIRMAGDDEDLALYAQEPNEEWLRK